MAGYPTKVIEVPDLNEGLEFSGSNITTDFDLNENTINASMGVYKGIGPRYGMAPVPGQNFKEVDTSSRLYPANLVKSEDTTNAITNRKNVWGCIPVKVASWSNYNTEETIFVWLVGHTSNYMSGSTDICSFTYGSEYTTASTNVRYNAWSGGIHKPLASTDSLPLSASGDYCLSSAFRWRTRFSYQGFRSYTASATQAKFYRWSMLSVSGKRLPAGYQLMQYVQSNSATVPGEFNPVISGWTRDQNFGTFERNPRTLTAVVIGDDGSGYLELSRIYTKSDVQLDTTQVTAVPDANDWTQNNTSIGYLTRFNTITYSGWSVTNGARVASLTGLNHAVIRSDAMSFDSSYKAFLMAADSPIGAILQDHVRDRTWFGSEPYLFVGNAMQYFDPCSHWHACVDFIDSNYAEFSIQKPRPYRYWPSFSGTALSDKDSVAGRALNGPHVTLGDANSGILRANTTYEIACAYYDKSTDTETNVSTPVKVRTGTDDYVALTVFRRSTAAPRTEMAAISHENLPIPVVRTTGAYPTYPRTEVSTIAFLPYQINFYELRWYYRALGEFDWMPAGKMDLASYYDPTIKTMWICEGAIAALPGGQPGGFVDHSPLSKDKYIDVLNFQGYVFWISKENLIYSEKNNVFNYPLLNRVTCPKGTFRGAIEHAYPGQAAQDSRLVVFSSEAVYTGRFKGPGYFIPMSVRTSPSSVGEFDRPGSDFRLDLWTGDTAFSARAAVVADGILYWWGPTGLFRDEGNTLPSKEFSTHLMPWLQTIYDPMRTDEIHAIYNSTSREIIWFFPPKATDTTYSQRALVYNVEHRAFYWFGIKSTYVDWAQQIDAQTASANNQDGNGRRIMLGIRSSVNGHTTTAQRVVYFDNLCRSGDFPIPYQVLIKEVASITGGYRLTMATGPASLSGITGTLTISGFKFYANSSLACDGIYTITGSTATTIDISTLAGVDALPIGTLTYPYYFPVWVESNCGFDFKIDSNYWAMAGKRNWNYYMACHQIYKVNLLTSASSQTLSLSFYGLTGASAATASVTLSDNSRGNCQKYTPIPFTEEGAEGQALRTVITTSSGRWNGGICVLQHLSFDVQTLEKDNIRHWES